MRCHSSSLTSTPYLNKFYRYVPVLVFLLKECVCLGTLAKITEVHELTADNITVRVKRHASGGVRYKIVSFSALNKHFVLTLTPGSPVLHPKFEAHLVDEKGTQTLFPVDLINIYSGHLNGVPDHGVDAAYVHGIWIAQIYAPDGVYVVEPRRVHDQHGPHSSMLVFKNPGLEPYLTKNSSQDGGMHSFCQQVQFVGGVPRLIHEDQVWPNYQDVQSFDPWSAKGMSRFAVKRHAFHGGRSSEKSLQHKHGTLDRRELHPRGIPGLGESHLLSVNDNLKYVQRRRKRKVNTGRLDTCTILAIADYDTYKGIGERSPSRVVAYLVNAYQGANRIFRSTHFGSFTDMGFQVKAMRIHTSYSTLPSERYNMANNKMDSLTTLKSMTSGTGFERFCVVHLTLQRTMGGTLGMACKADPQPDVWSNGICARVAREQRNIGFSVTISSEGTPLPMSTYTVVLTHELGHNWGATHDPANKQSCSPSTAFGGKYLMWAYAGLVGDRNAQEFSPCSRVAIAALLKAKAHLCFSPHRVQGYACGDGIVSAAEDCDVGFARQDKDKCCQKNCRFRPDAVCSPFNHPCCSDDCQVAPSTQTCHHAVTDECYQTSYCSGTEHRMCPLPMALPNNSTCANNGRCSHGRCVSFCEYLGLSQSPPQQLQTCTCDTDFSSLCLHCCRDMARGTPCQVMGGAQENGVPCMYGFCKHGRCQTTEGSRDEWKAESRLLQNNTSRQNVRCPWLYITLGGVLLLFTFLDLPR